MALGERFAEKIKSMDVRAVIGSGCLWAWVDALFMSAFFAPFGDRAPLPEAAAWAVSLVGIPICLVLFSVRSQGRRVLSSRPAVLVFGGAGMVGSSLFILIAQRLVWAVFGLACVLFACSMSCLIMCWGSVYCHRGMDSAVAYVAGGFACAFIIDALFLRRVPACRRCRRVRCSCDDAVRRRELHVYV